MSHVVKRSRFLGGFWVTAVIVTGGGCCLGYVFYNSNAFSERRRKLQRLFNSLSALADTLYSSSEVSAAVARDLQQFILSDSDEVPQSLKQILKLSRSSEFQVAITRLSAAVAQGGLKGLCATASDLQAAFAPSSFPSASCASAVEQKLPFVDGTANEYRLPERLLDKLYSEPGQGFASALVGRAVRTLVQTYFEQAAQAGKQAKYGSRRKGVAEGSHNCKSSETHIGAHQEDWEQRWLKLASSPEGKAVMSNIVSTFAVNAMSTYLEKTSGMNVCEDILSVVTKEQYREPTTEILKSVCSDTITSLIRTSHDALSIPETRQLAVEVAGAMSSQGIRAFAMVCMDMFRKAGSSKALEVHLGQPGSLRPLAPIRAIAAKAMTTVSVCLALCLHLVTGTRAVYPAGSCINAYGP